MEINPIFPPKIEFEVKFSNDQSWNGDHFFFFFFCSASNSLKLFFYSLFKIEYNNVIFFHNLVRNKFSKIRSIDELCDEGSRNKFDRKQKFPNSLEVEFLLENSQLDNFQKINDSFKKYKGKFDLLVND
jgi:hypothetical protein